LPFLRCGNTHNFFYFSDDDGEEKVGVVSIWYGYVDDDDESSWGSGNKSILNKGFF